MKRDILNTLDVYLEEHPALQIALLHIDTDVYAPCAHGLSLLFDRIVPGGILVLDDYAIVEGATKAVNEFFEGKLGNGVALCKLPYADKPTYMIKKIDM